MLAGLVRSMAPIVNCVIFESDPVGVHEVSAIELVQMIVSTKMSGSEMKASSHGTPKNSCVTQAPSTLKTGMPTAEIHSGNSMCSRTSAPAVFSLRLKMPLKISGRPSRLTSEPTTIIVTPHHSDHWLTISAREIGTTAPVGPMRATMSPAWIMIGARMTKLMKAPSRQLVATAIPMRPPTPSIAASSVRRSPSWRMSVPRIVGIQPVRLGGGGVVVGVEPLVEDPRLLQAGPLVQPQDLELQELHPAVADDHLVEARERAP